MMGRVADLSDMLRSTVPFLTWRDERLTRAVLHLAVVSSLPLALAAPFVPWRLVFFVAGEAAFFLGHPVVQTFLADLAPHVSASSRDRSRLVRKLLEDDALDDDELEMEVVEVQRIEVDTRVHAAPPDAAWQTEAVVGGELPTGFRWLGEWEDAAPADGAVDAGAFLLFPILLFLTLPFSLLLLLTVLACRRVDLHPPRRHAHDDAVRPGRERAGVGAVEAAEAHASGDQESAAVRRFGPRVMCDVNSCCFRSLLGLVRHRGG